ncbi:MAG: hypothetical protein ACR2KT_07470 [Methylocella sp.]|nr:MAG: hypothetical protein DLM68_11300 [Hyphomicrobiales bacterium]
MSVQVQLRRDTLANVLANKGAVGEVFITTDTHGLFVQDGVTNGGFTPNGTSPARAATAIDASSVPHGGSIQFGCQEELLTALSGATKVSTITFPNPCIILGVSCRVTTAITGAASFNVGRTGGTANEFGNVAVAVNTTNAGILTGGIGQFSSVTVTLTAVGGNFTAGAVRIQLNYILLNPPTS